MAKRIRRLFSAEFKLEAAQLFLDQSYSVVEAANLNPINITVA